MADFTELQDWLQRSSARQKFYAGTFWFVFSSLGETLPVRLGNIACTVGLCQARTGLFQVPSQEETAR